MDRLEVIKSKIVSPEQIKSLQHIWNLKDYTTIFTNGCFDLLHRGHIEYLARASNLGDILIVGVNTDASIKKIKGNNRPIQDEYSRALLVAALHFVDNVVLFDDDTPIELIKLIKPHVLVKGGDWEQKEIVGADFVKQYNGQIITIDYINNFSTTNLINKILKINL